MPANQKLFRELSQPFENNDAADKAITDFFEDLGALREKHKLRDVYVIIAGSAIGSSGEEGEFLTRVQYGDSTKAEAMCAWAFGVEATARKEMIAEVLSGKRTTSRREK